MNGLRAIWRKLPSANVLTIPIDALFEGLLQHTWSHLLHGRDVMIGMRNKIIVDTEVLSLHLAKITSTMTYGVRAKCEPGCIGDDKEEEIEGTVASNEKDKIGKTLDPLGPARIRHLPEDGFILEDVAFVETEGQCRDESANEHSEPIIQNVLNMEVRIEAKFVEEVDKVAGDCRDHQRAIHGAFAPNGMSSMLPMKR